MGYGSSKEEQHSSPGTARPHRPVELQSFDPRASQSARGPHVMTQRDLTARIRIKFLAAIHAAMEDTEYGIIGGAALAEYGNLWDTSDVDIITPQDVSLVLEGQLLSRGMVRTAGGCLGYIAASCLGFHPSTLLRHISEMPSL